MPKTPRNVCIFRGSFIREQVDPRVKVIWKEKTGKEPPFGDLRRIWRQRHCSEVNPYGSDMCPYTEADCSLAFLQAIETSLSRSTSNPTGYFRRVARTGGERRAEDKPLTRNLGPATGHPDASGRTIMGGDAQGPGDPGNRQPGPAEGQGDVPRPITRPIAIGDLLGSLDLRPRTRPSDDGEAGTK